MNSCLRTLQHLYIQTNEKRRMKSINFSESLITGQYTTSSDNSRRTTVSTATETGVTMEPTTTLQASSNDVFSQVACSSHDALDHTQPRMTFATVNKEVLQTFADKTRNYNTKKTTLTWIKRF